MSPDTQNALSTAPGRFKPIARTDRPSNGLVPLPKPGEAPAETFSQLLKSYDAAQGKRAADAASQAPTLSAALPPRPYPGPAPAPQTPVAPPAAAEQAPKPAEGAKPYTGARPQTRNEAQRHEQHKALAKPGTAGNKTEAQAQQAGKTEGPSLDEAEDPAQELRLSDLSDQPGIRGHGSDRTAADAAMAGIDANTPREPLAGERSSDLAAAGLLGSDKADTLLQGQIQGEMGSQDFTPSAKSRGATTGLGTASLRAQAKAEPLGGDAKAAGALGAELKAQSGAAEGLALGGDAALARRSEASGGRAEAASFDKLLAANVSGSSAAALDKPGSSGTTEKPQVMMSAPLYDSAFAPEMAARLSVLAADGVQEAQLHLNPAEMGPVAVSIVVDGQQAQISFHAEQSETRQVLEKSLPDLAAALRDSGLTLSGGGVFQQAQDQASSQQGRGQDSRALAGARQDRDVQQNPVSTSPVARPRVSQGVLDMYA